MAILLTPLTQQVSYMAPETVTGSSFKASDVWSYAVVTWQLVTGEVAPWPGLRNVQIIMGVMQVRLGAAARVCVFGLRGHGRKPVGPH